MKPTYEPLYNADRARDSPPPSILAELKKHMRLAGPLMFTHLMDYLPGATNVLLVSWMDTPDADIYVNAATLSTMYLNFTSIALGMGLCTALGTLCSQAHGAGKTKQFNSYVQSASLGLLLTLVPMCLLNWNADVVLVLMGHDRATVAKAAAFTRLSTVGLPCFFAFEIVRKLLQAHSLVDAVALFSLASNGIHLGLGYYLTQHTGWSFYGAALARSIANVTLVLFLVPYFCIFPHHKAWGLHWDWGLAKAHLVEFYTLGAPGVVMFWVEFGSFGAMTLLAKLLPHPTLQTHVNTILSHLLSSLYVVYFGIASATMVRVGNELGANRPAHAQFVMRTSFLLVIVCAVVVVVAVATTRHAIAASFYHDPAVVHAATTALLYTLPILFLSAMNTNAQGVYRGLGLPAVGALVNVVAVYCVGLPMAAAIGLDWCPGLAGLWAGFTTGPTTSSVVFAVLLTRIDWRALADAAAARSSAP
ncbi:Aste57867_16362 [Aphanomyces stellatus]|uniref:Aste57867_16362 protein n=1 Tax=Aphanomyces stellatus TaxID=120398 RepID=A0A485L631_9STRA|nr:hypothetical protein As57867_016305 [Aphanomyces stellatus]VFT93138.1 Aste57867_16362 [Aphanomyces stellatus]